MSKFISQHPYLTAWIVLSALSTITYVVRPELFKFGSDKAEGY